jgi:putative heme-binding domain-containing protein
MKVQFGFSLFALLTLMPVSAHADPLELQKGDHISIIGNTLADRMQHDGWLETLIQSRFPRHDLVFRNLGFSGDELTLRLRSAGFGSPDEWLTRCKTDVIFAFFGFNESFGGEAGLPKFKKDLEDFIKHTVNRRYNGKDRPRLVLFSPIAHENLKDRNLPDGRANNKRIELYTWAMAEVAKANNVTFVDLFKPTRDLYEKAAKPLTVNGVHLNEAGNRAVAEIIDKALFPSSGNKTGAAEALKRLRQAVVDKDFTWFNLYRTVDGYSIYGGRADLEFVDKQTNREVAQREMQILDVMTASRDKRIGALAQGKDYRVDDNDTPPFIPVKTNKPGPGPGGAHIFLDGEEAIGKMTVARGMKVNLFASEKDFPELAKPVQMQFDAKGRLWVAVWPSYPHWKPKEEMNDKILILEDTKGTGKADKCTVFADHLHCPTGFEFYNGGVLVAQAPDLMFLKDSKGDGKADIRVRVLDGLDSADTHHTSNSFALDPGGAIYFQEGTFHHTQVETPYGPPVRCANAGVYRYEPRTQKFDTYVTYGFANPHGHVWDRWGQDFVYDGTGANPYHGALFSGHLDYPNKHNTPPQVYQQRTRPCPGVEILSSRHFPEANQGNLLVGNVIGFQGILQYKVVDKDSSFTAIEQEPIVFSSDPSFRPSDLKIGPDGAIYFLDWINPIIGHMQHNLRDPSRDRIHGRVYRITYEDRPLLKPVKIAGEPIEKLLDVLKEPEDRVRYQARIELAARDTDQVIAALTKWIAGLDPEDAIYEHNMLEALWLHQNHNVVNEELLKRELASSDFHARAAATRVLCYWHDRIPSALDLLKKLAADSSARVRLEAVRAASFFAVPEAIEVPLISADQPTDVYLDFVRGETMRALDPYVKKAVAEGRDIAFNSPSAARYFLKNVSTDDLLKLKRTRGVFLELLFRKGVRDEFRKEALTGLAKLEKKKDLDVLVDAIKTHDEQQGQQDEGVVFDLVRLLTSLGAEQLVGARSDLEKLATSAKSPVTRQLGYVALIAADGTAEKAWAQASRSTKALSDFVNAVPLICDPNQRSSLYSKIEPLLDGLPKELASGTNKGKTTEGRFVRIELPGRHRTLTLAEVEIYSGGRNIARQGKASQKNTAHGGVASRATDGNRNNTYSAGGQTHTEENTADPWWEVDLGGQFPIESIVIYNRHDGDLYKRLDGFTLTILDSKRGTVFEKKGQPAPIDKASFEIGHDSPEQRIRRAAMTALTSVRGQEEHTFTRLAKFVADKEDRQAAVQALLHIPTTYWPKAEAKPLLDSILSYVRTVPVAERTSPAVLDTLQLADALLPFLTKDEAQAARKELGELGVRVIRLATVPDQMLFDKERLAVRAGKPVEIIFENNDLMPHNFVIIQPGSLDEIGNLGETTATQPGAAARNYVPESKKILVASRLIAPRDSQKLSFTAPATPGIYPYVCTYPGHWRRMFGALYVVQDFDDYQADPEAYVAKHPLPIVDELLKFNRPRKEWKFDDLASAVEKLESGRSFNSGKQIFQVASCVSCHKLGGAGVEFGPDLTKLDPKQQKPIEILRDILEPSFRINEKYQTFSFELKSGKQVSGIILEETPTTYKLIENPLLKAEAVIVKKTDVDEMKKLPTSIMPKGLLDKLTREEILDLIAYVWSGADGRHKVFQGEHQHHH